MPVGDMAPHEIALTLAERYYQRRYAVGPHMLARSTTRETRAYCVWRNAWIDYCWEVALRSHKGAARPSRFHDWSEPQ